MGQGDDQSDVIAALERRVAELEHRLRYDDLTGVMTKVAFFDLFPDRARAGQYFFFVDLDDFKSVNDSFGHLIGDRLIAAIAAVIRDVVGTHGIVARLAGDEFLALLDTRSEREARAIADKVLAAVSQCRLKLGELEVSRRASIGLARLSEGMNVQEAIIEADTALREAKQAGKGRIICQGERMNQLMLSRPSLEEVRLGLRRKEIGYHVQPIVDLNDGRIWGYEALLRWRRANGEVLGPTQFLDNMTGAYDQKARPPLEAAHATADWAVLEQGRHVAFNISTAFLARVAEQGMAWVDDIVGNVPPEKVVFELVETVINEPNEAVEAVVRELRAAGVRVALDDFGIGQSTLERLQRVQVDFVKIDRHFVQSASRARRDHDMLSHMVDLIHASGAEPIIEGVETAAHIDLARGLGVRFAQGFLLGRPAPVEDWTGIEHVSLGAG